MTDLGVTIDLDIGPVAHGGHCVARHDGRVVFVRHTLPGERVRARLTHAPDGASFWRADAIDVLDASPDRVPPAWPAAGAGGVGGGELSHVALAAQRRWKEQVLDEQLRRLARVERDVTVHPAPGDDERGGLAWRTRMTLVTDERGRAGMHRHRSHDVLALDDMPLATEQIADLGLFSRSWPAGVRIDVAAPASGGRPVVLVDGGPWTGSGPDRRPNARTSVQETVPVGDRTFRFQVAASGFWQVHRRAPEVLVDAVLTAAAPGGTGLAGATVVDLYAGAGLFTAPLAEAVGPGGAVHAVEGDAGAHRSARRSLHGLRQAVLHHGDVTRVLARGGRVPAVPAAADLVVLDPPRSGAGRRVLELVAGRRPGRIVYVACDPAALARDLAYLDGHGYDLESVEGYDLFPHTHHVEAVAALARR